MKPVEKKIVALKTGRLSSPGNIKDSKMRAIALFNGQAEAENADKKTSRLGLVHKTSCHIK